MNQENKKLLLMAIWSPRYYFAPDEKIVYKIPFNFEKENLGEKFKKN